MAAWLMRVAQQRGGDGMKLILKVLLIPVIALLTVVQWIGIILTNCSGMIVKLIAGVLFVVAFIGYLIDPGIRWHAVDIMVLAFVVFILPYVAGWIVYRITDLNLSMRKFIRS